MSALPQPEPQIELLDLRHFSAAQLGPLLRDEAGRWQQRLHWDYTAATQLLLDYLDGRVLPGFVALQQRRILGYSFCVYEGAKAVIGDAYAFGEANSLQNPVCETLLGQVISMLQASPGVDRIESQLLMFSAGALRAPFAAAGFRPYRRLFMSADLATPVTLLPAAALPPGVEFQPWRASYYEAAAQLIRDAYHGHTDADINDQYRSLAGAQRFLHNIVRFPGCGVFDPENSWVIRSPRGSGLLGVLLCSRVLPQAAHITQLCIAPTHRGTHLGQQLLHRCMAGLRQRGIRLLSLTVTESNTPACELYRQHGFRTEFSFEAMVWEARTAAGMK